MKKLKTLDIPKFDKGLSVNSFWQLLKYSLLRPHYYSQKVNLQISPKITLTIFLIYTSAGYFLGTLFQQILDFNHPQFFYSLSQAIFIIPFSLIFLFGFTGVLHLLAKLAKGQASFTTSLNGVIYSATPLIFFNLPYLNIIACIISLFLLIKIFKRAHQYSILVSMFNILFPVLILILIISSLSLTSSLV